MEGTFMERVRRIGLRRWPRGVLAAGMLSLAPGCSGHTATSDGGVTDVGPTTPVTLTLNAVVGSVPFTCTMTYPNLGTTHTTWTPTDFRLYVSDIKLITASGTEVPLILDEDGMWQHDGVALLDYENGMGTCAAGTPQMNNQVVGRIPVGSYVGLHFQVGVPFALDHANVSVASPPLDVGGMFWSWGTGYQFMHIEGGTTGVPSGYLIHLGSSGCTTNDMGLVLTPCTSPNRIDVDLPSFDPATQTVAIDYAALTAATNLDTITGAVPGCFADPMDADCVALFATMGLPYAGVNPPGPQSFITAR